MTGPQPPSDPWNTAAPEPGPPAPDAAVLRVRDSRGQTVGVAFLVSDTTALTCAHVVSAALGTAGGAAPPPTARVRVDLPLVPAARHEGEAPSTTAGVEQWTAPREAGGPAPAAGPAAPGDIAVLRLDAPLPAARPVPLVDPGEVWGHRVRAFGIPAGRPGGVWHAGVLRGRQADGWVQADLDGRGY
ncbi:trypsin-like peptidase domain-containing protein, partial [Streptomyces sp. NPDC020875]|uniref:trypsin-like peptidase domain-containing protein n=1 Tax=Streptomyces sp. NPDC020875 TaxID=3154898 RepID=UPI0033C30FB2